MSPPEPIQDSGFILYYWPGIPGRGEYIRLLLEHSRIPYASHTDPATLLHTLSTPALTGPTPHFAPPALRFPSGHVLSQTGAILHLLAPHCGLAGARGSLLDTLTPAACAKVRALDNAALARAEEERASVTQLVLSALDWQTEAHDVHHPVAASLYYEEQQAEAARAAGVYRKTRLPRWMGYFQSVLAANTETEGGRVYLLGATTTAADLVLFQVVDGHLFAYPRRMAQLRAGGKYADVFALYERVRGEKGIKEYLASERRQKYSNGIFRHYEELDKEEEDSN